MLADATKAYDTNVSTLESHYLLERTAITGYIATTQERRAAAGMEGSSSLTEFVSHIYTTLRGALKNPAKEMFT
jgi:hypothetical protein